jgi:hypothetical protein
MNCPKVEPSATNFTVGASIGASVVAVRFRRPAPDPPVGETRI